MATDRVAERRRRRTRRHARIRKKLRGTAERPRLVVARSHRNIEGQVIDDDRGVTLVGASTRSPDTAGAMPEEGVEYPESYAAGQLLARRAREAGVEQVVFDRGGYPYHGRVKAFAEGARAGGLVF
jgi:large subunit ribosomal protein L18